MESWAFLGIIFIIALLAKNQSLMLATGVVLIFKAIPLLHKYLPMIQEKGINWGVTIISITILIPIATEQIGFKDLLHAFQSPIGWIAVFCGVLVAVLSSKGVGLLTTSPEVTVALVFGTIMGVVLLKGVAAGPVIAAGMTYCILQVINIFFTTNP